MTVFRSMPSNFPYELASIFCALAVTSTSDVDAFERTGVTLERASAVFDSCAPSLDGGLFFNHSLQHLCRVSVFVPDFEKTILNSSRHVGHK